MLYKEVGASLGTDYVGLYDDLTPHERDLWTRTRDFVTSPCCRTSASTGTTPSSRSTSSPRWVPWGSSETASRATDAPPMSALASGLVHMEINRGDGSLGAFLAIQSGLVMKSIDLLGSEEQRARWLPSLSRLDAVGAFALTEPLHGSDSVRLEATATPTGSGYVLNGEKRWNRQRQLRRRHRGLGPRHLRRPGQGLPRRRRWNRGLRRRGDHRQGLGPCRLANRHHPYRRPCAPHRGPARRPHLQGRRPGPRSQPHPGRLDVTGPRHRRLRMCPELRPTTPPVRRAPGRPSAHPREARHDAR